MLFVLFLILIAVIFEFMNGLNDSANAVATSIATRVLTAGQAVFLAATFDLCGALAGTAVAKTVASGLVEPGWVTLGTILCALLGAIAWNLFTWRFGIPSSSSHALIGALAGATLATARGNWAVIKWASFNPVTHKTEGLLYKVVVPMFSAPVVGLLCGFIFTSILFFLIRSFRPDTVNRVFGKLQIVAAAWTSFSHGMNDAQKTMGIMALTLFTATKAGIMDHLPGSLAFLQMSAFDIPLWIKLLCAGTIAVGIACGGRRIIKTVGKGLTRLQPIHGFAAQTAGAVVIQAASLLGIPLSTTHVVSSSIMGVGAAKRFNAVKWGVMARLIWAWVFTIPITGFIGYGLFHVFRIMGLWNSIEWLQPR
jgi:PiT family inorganic phosphate transporter